jgi:hypothetical protein
LNKKGCPETLHEQPFSEFLFIPNNDSSLTKTFGHQLAGNAERRIFEECL